MKADFKNANLKKIEGDPVHRDLRSTGLAFQNERLSVIIAAGGSSSRMNGEDKQMMLLQDVPVIVHTVKVFNSFSKTSEIIVSVRAEKKEIFRDVFNKYIPYINIKLVSGGESRAESVLAALCEMNRENSFVGVHDGARPFVTLKLIEKIFDAAKICGAAVPFVKPKDTVKNVSHGKIETLTRENLIAVQTPQIFSSELYRELTADMTDFSITDDSILFERANLPLELVEGDYNNIKVTTPDDMLYADFLMERIKK